MDKGQDMEEKKKWVSSLYMDRLRCNGMINPLGISGECLLFQWIIAGRGENILQYCCRLQVSERKDFTDLIYENVLYSGDTQWEIRLGLEEKTKYYWRVQACVDENLWLDWSVPASFETGMKGEESWKADWIEAEDTFYQDGGEMNMSPCLYKEWVLDGGWESGRIYITAHGFYELRINGKKVGSYALAPDFTAYDKSIYYQTFDLGDCLLEGKNSLEILLADGWYAGHAQGIPGLNHLYGERPALILQAEIRYPDGQICELLSDDTFTAYTTPIRYADLFMGEVYDTGRVRKQYGTVLREYPKNVLMPQEYEGIEEKTILEAISLSEIEKGTYIVDFGQVTAGRERLYLKGEKGSRIKVEHSEMLDPETGDLLEITQNFPNHAQTDYVYINEGLISTRTGLSQQEIYDVLIGLSKYRIVNYIPHKKTPLIIYTRTREEIKYLSIPRSAYEERKERFENRMNRVIDYIEENRICRSRMLITYFGEKDTSDCGCCDVCLAKNDSGLNNHTFNTIREALLKTLEDNGPQEVKKLTEELSFPADKIITAIRFLSEHDDRFSQEDGILSLTKTNTVSDNEQQ